MHRRQNPILKSLICLLLSAGLIPGCAWMYPVAPKPVQPAGFITQDTVWQGLIEITQDILVPAGVTLTIKPGTLIRFTKNKQGQIDPRFLFTGHELLVRGNIRAGGTPERPIIFTSAQSDPQAGDWAGIILDHVSGEGSWFTYCQIQYAETGIYCIRSSPRITCNDFENTDYGIICQREACPEIAGNLLLHGETGIACWDTSAPLIMDNYIAYQRQAGIMQSREAMPWAERNIVEYNRYGLFGGQYYSWNANQIRQNEQDFYPDTR